MRALVLGCLLAGCLEREPDVTSVAQNVRENWQTIDDTTSNEYRGIAISPTTHKVFVLAVRRGFAALRGSKDGTTFAWNGAFGALDAPDPIGITVDSQGTWYVLTFLGGNSVPYYGGVIRVYKSSDDGASWSIALNQTGLDHNTRPNGISVDSAGYVWISGLRPGSGLEGEVLRGAGRGAFWTTSLALTSAHGSKVIATCEGLYAGQLANFALTSVWISPEDVGGVYVSLDHGLSWTQTPITTRLPHGCATTATGDLGIASAAFTSPGSEWHGQVWNVASASIVNDDTITTLDPDDPFVALSIANTGMYQYDAGEYFGVWGIRRMVPTAGGDTIQSDLYIYPGTSFPAFGRVVAMAYDGVRGLYAVGLAVDAAGDPHAIIRRKL